jgi:hypothetical protein
MFHDALLALVEVIVLRPYAERGWRWLSRVLWRLLGVPTVGGAGGDVTLRPGKGAPGYPDGRVIIETADGERHIVVGIHGVWFRGLRSGASAPLDPKTGDPL